MLLLLLLLVLLLVVVLVVVLLLLCVAVAASPPPRVVHISLRYEALEHADRNVHGFSVTRHAERRHLPTHTNQ